MSFLNEHLCSMLDRCNEYCYSSLMHFDIVLRPSANVTCILWRENDFSIMFYYQTLLKLAFFLFGYTHTELYWMCRRLLCSLFCCLPFERCIEKASFHTSWGECLVYGHCYYCQSFCSEKCLRSDLKIQSFYWGGQRLYCPSNQNIGGRVPHPPRFRCLCIQQHKEPMEQGISLPLWVNGKRYSSRKCLHYALVLSGEAL